MKILRISETAQGWIDFFAIAGPWLSCLILAVSMNPMIVCGRGLEADSILNLITVFWLAVPGLLLGVLCTKPLERWLGWAGFAWMTYMAFLALKQNFPRMSLF